LELEFHDSSRKQQTIRAIVISYELVSYGKLAKSNHVYMLMMDFMWIKRNGESNRSYVGLQIYIKEDIQVMITILKMDFNGVLNTNSIHCMT
jgi:hypothetical protein